MYKYLDVDGLTIRVSYDVIPAEQRNYGSMDSRLPDEPREVIINNVALVDYSPDAIEKLIKECRDGTDNPSAI